MGRMARQWNCPRGKYRNGLNVYMCICLPSQLGSHIHRCIVQRTETVAIWAKALRNQGREHCCRKFSRLLSSYSVNSSRKRYELNKELYGNSSDWSCEQHDRLIGQHMSRFVWTIPYAILRSIAFCLTVIVTVAGPDKQTSFVLRHTG